MKEEYLGTAQLISIRKTKRANINEFIAHIDTGYNKARVAEILSRMYKKKADNDLVFGCFKWVKIQEGCSVDLKTLLKKEND